MNSPNDKIVRRKAGEIPSAAPGDLARLRAAQEGDINTSEIPERATLAPLVRDESGNLPRKSMIRDAVAAVVSERGISAYMLWKEARAYCPTISESAVGEFLKGERQIGLNYAEALLTAAGLAIVRREDPRQAPTC